MNKEQFIEKWGQLIKKITPILKDEFESDLDELLETKIEDIFTSSNTLDELLEKYERNIDAFWKHLKSLNKDSG